MSYLSNPVDREEMLLSEPNPILPPPQGGNVRVVPEVTILPCDIMRFSQDYILVLRGIEKETQCFSLPSETDLDGKEDGSVSSHAVPLPSWEEETSFYSDCMGETSSKYADFQPVLADANVNSNLTCGHSSLGDNEEENVPPSPSLPRLARLPTQKAQPNNSANVRKVALYRYQVEQWQKRYLDLETYANEHGNSDVPHDYEEDPGLVLWVKRQRKNFTDKMLGRPSPLTDERLALLNKLNFEWDIHARSWLGNYNKLLEFHEKHGNGKVTNMYDKSLCNWVKRQKRLCRLFLQGHKSCTPSCMTTERVLLLSKIGLV